MRQSQAPHTRGGAMAGDANPERCWRTSSATKEANFLWELRKYALLQALLASSVTYTAGLSPLGGLWPDNDGAHFAGDHVLKVTHTHLGRYRIFFYFNTTAFVASVVTTSLLLFVHSHIRRRRWWIRAVQAAMILNQLSLMGAYVAGSCGAVAMSAYVLTLVALVSIYVCACVLLFALCALRTRDGGGGGGKNVAPEAPDAVARPHNVLFIFTTLVATVTFQAGLSTPGGFLSSNSQGDERQARGPMLRGDRLMAFFYLNTTAFVASLVVIMLLMSRTVTRQGFRYYALWVCMGLALVGLTGAFFIGSSRSAKTSIYVTALLAGVLLSMVPVFWCTHKANWLLNVQGTLRKYLKLDRQLPSSQDHRVQFQTSSDLDADQLLKKSRQYLLLVGLLAASVTYQAALNPPGGLWQSNAADGVHHYLAGDPVVRTTDPQRYMAFFYCNATAFVASLVIVVLLLKSTFSTQGINYSVLQATMILDLLGLIGAYAAGSRRQVSKSVYISVIVVLVFLGIHVLVFPNHATWREMVKAKLEQAVPEWFKKLFEPQSTEEEEEDEDMKRRLRKNHKLLLLLAILAASLTYQGGLSPPGGFWQENQTGHVVGNPVLKDKYPRRYLVFFYCNTTAFVASLATIMLLVNSKLSARGIQSYALRVFLILDLIGLMGAFTSASSREVSTSVYVFILLFAFVLCIVPQVVLVMSESVQTLLQSIISLFGIIMEEEKEAADGLLHTAADGEARDSDPSYGKYLAETRHDGLVWFVAKDKIAKFSPCLIVVWFWANTWPYNFISVMFGLAMDNVWPWSKFGLIAVGHKPYKPSVTTMGTSASSGHTESHEWVLDSSAWIHHTSNPRLLLDGGDLQKTDKELPKGDDALSILGYGSVRTEGFEVSGVCYVEGDTRNVVSVNQLSRDHGLVTVFESTQCYVMDPATGQNVGRGRFRNGKYVLDALLIGQDVDTSLLDKFSQESSETKAAQRYSSESQTTMRTPWSVQTDHNVWVLDTRAPSHHTSNPQLLLGGAYLQETAKELPQSGGDAPLNIKHGHVRTMLFHVPDVRYVEGDERNVISVSQLSSNHDLVIVFEPTRCYIKDKKTGQIVGRGHLHDSVYVLDSLHIGQEKGGRVGDKDKGKQEVEDGVNHCRDEGRRNQDVSEGGDSQDGGASGDHCRDGGEGGDDYDRDSAGGEADDGKGGRAGGEGGDGDDGGDDGRYGKGTEEGGHEEEEEDEEKGDDEGNEIERHQESSHGGFLNHPQYESLCPCGRNVLVILSGACEKCGLGPPKACQRNDDTIAGAEGCVLVISTQGGSSSEPSMDFVMDSGAGSHMTWNGDPGFLQKYAPLHKPPVLSVNGVGGATCRVDGWGKLTTGTITLNEVLHVPDGGVNLVSVSKLVDAYKARVVFERKYFMIQSLEMSNEVIGNGRRNGTHYFLDSFNPDG